MEWQSIACKVETFRNLPKVRPLPTLCTHVPLVILLMSIMASDLSDGRLKVRGTLGQIGPDNGWFYVLLTVIAVLIASATYRAVTAAEALWGYRSK